VSIFEDASGCLGLGAGWPAGAGDSGLGARVALWFVAELVIFVTRVRARRWGWIGLGRVSNWGRGLERCWRNVIKSPGSLARRRFRVALYPWVEDVGPKIVEISDVASDDR
jgi:hypothetical protein